LLLPEPVPLRLELLELRACGSVLGEFLPRLLAGPGPRDLGRVAVALLRPRCLTGLSPGLLQRGVGVVSAVT